MTYRKFHIFFIIISAILYSIAGPSISYAQAQNQELNSYIDSESTKILKNMSSYLSSTEAFSFQIVVTDKYPSESGETVEIKKTALLKVQRPGRLKIDVTTTEPESERTFYYNGKTITLFNKTEKLYAQIDVPDTNERALDFAMEDLGFTFPVIDFVFNNLYQNLTENVITSDYIGETVVRGHPCHLLSFNQENIDWYLWVGSYKKPVPRKILIVYKNDPMRSKFIAEFTDFKVF
jgi:hypothetical protein